MHKLNPRTAALLSAFGWAVGYLLASKVLAVLLPVPPGGAARFFRVCLLAPLAGSDKRNRQKHPRNVTTMRSGIRVYSDFLADQAALDRRISVNKRKIPQRHTDYLINHEEY